MARVLVMDDEEHVADAVRHVLEAAGHEVAVAHDAETGIALAAASPPDLVVLDLGLPDLDGLEVLGRLRPRSSAPVLVLSGWSDEGRRLDALAAGAADYLVKPFNVRELQARASELLVRHQA